MNQRAYSTLEIKAATEDGGKRRFSGIASTPETDRMGDIVEPKGAEFKLPLPLLWQHDSRNPIGWVTKARVTDAGIEIEGEVASMVDDPESDLGKQLKTYWQYIKSGLVRGLSIGFNAKETARIEGTYGYRIMKWAWLELSAVTIPANEQATILAIKSADQALLAASGHLHRHARTQALAQQDHRRRRFCLQASQGRLGIGHQRGLGRFAVPGAIAGILQQHGLEARRLQHRQVVCAAQSVPGVAMQHEDPGAAGPDGPPPAEQPPLGIRPWHQLRSEGPLNSLGFTFAAGKIHHPPLGQKGQKAEPRV